MKAIDWGFTVSETAERLMVETSKAQENGPEYALLTATNAAAAAGRARPSSLKSRDRSAYIL